MQTLFLYFGLAGLSVCLPTFVVLWLHAKGICPIEEVTSRFRRLPVLARIILGVIAVNLFVYGGTKTNQVDQAGGETNGTESADAGTTNAPPLLCLPRPPALPPADGPAEGFTPEQLAAGFVMVEARTNETWDFSMPSGAVEVAEWRRRGAFEDWTVPTNGLAGTEGVYALPRPGVIFSNGFAEDSIRETSSVFAPLDADLSVAPEANWPRVAGTGAESRVWHLVTDSNSVVVTWQDVLLGRETNQPVSVQAEFFENGNFIYRYDLSRIEDESFLTNAQVVALKDGFGVRRGIGELLSSSRTLTSVFFHALSPEDAGTSDRDGDGLLTYDEIFHHGTDPGLYDTDGDGLPDGEEILRGSDPHLPDTDADGLVDGSDPDPVTFTDSLDEDGDGIRDSYENYWFGGTDAVDGAEARDETGFTLAGKIAAGRNPTNEATSFNTVSTNELVSWKLWDSFCANWSGQLTNLVFERTIPIDRKSNWQQFYLSSRPDAADGWSLEGMVLEWCDSEGACGTVTASRIGDSYYLPLSTNDPRSVTFRLRATASYVRSPTPVHLVCYAPTFGVEGGCEITLSNGEKVTVFVEGSDSEIGLTIDRSKRPCKAGLYPGETFMGGVVDMAAESSGAFAYEGDADGGQIHASGAGIYYLPEIAVKGVSARPRRLLLGTPGNAGRPIIVLSPSVWYGEHHCGSYGVGWSEEGHYVEYYYPIDSDCLWREWHHDSWGGWVCDCQPSASCGLGNGNGYAHVETSVEGDTVTATVYVGDTAVWSGKATHYFETGCGGTGIEKVDSCDSCKASCKNGRCDALEGPSLSSLKFRIPVGNPRGEQVSGFAYFDTEGPIAVSPATFRYLFRPDADVTVTTNGDARTVACLDNRGRDLVIEPIANGVRVTVNTHATGAWEHSWEIVNVNGSASRVRLRQISRLYNTMQDWLYEYAREDEDDEESPFRWRATDLVSGIREEVSKTDCLNSDGTISEHRIKYDLEGNWLGEIEKVSELVGEGETVSLCETSRREWTACNEIVREADYWRDPEHPARNGRLRLLTATDAPWQYHEWDSDGRETYVLEQRNGSGAPTAFPVVSSNGVEDAGNAADAMLTVYGYTPLAGDGCDRGDYARPRTETRYVIRDGEAILIGRTWHRLTHRIVNGFPTLRDEQWRAATPSAAFGDAGNVWSYCETVDAVSTCDLPIVLRGRTVEELDEDGRLMTCEISVATGIVTCVTRTFFGETESPTYAVSEFDSDYGNVLREAKLLTANDALIGEERSTYDDQNRLRSTVYLDGTSLTNAYSCCRKLWSRDREGRRTLRSAVTGEDTLYYAEEEVWLREVSTNGLHKVTQHFVDAFGRETNTVIYVADAEGEATDRTASDGRRLSEAVAAYSGLADDCADSRDGRGLVTEKREDYRADRVETHQESFADDIPYESRLRTSKVAVRNGRTATRRSWNGKWTESADSADYDADGCRVEVSTTESSDYGLVTNAVVRFDFLGRKVREDTPEGTTVYSYDGVSRRILDETYSAGCVERTTSHVYDALGEEIGTECDGVVSETVTVHELRLNEWWQVTRETEHRQDATNFFTETAVRLTGLSDALRSHKVSVAADGAVTDVQRSFDPATSVLTEIETSSVRAPVVRTFKYGLQLDETVEGVRTSFAYDALGQCVARIRNAEHEEYAYSSTGELVEKRTYTNGWACAVESYGYDSNGRIVAETEADGRTISYRYDGMGNVIAEEGATHPKLYGYDSQGHRISLATTRDGTAWDVTRWTYDGATGRCLAKTYADGSSETYVYAPDGKRTGVIRPGNVWEESRYDGQRRLVSVTTADGCVGYGYDAFGRIVAVSNAVAASRFGLDRSGTATNEMQTVGTNAFRIVRTVDGAGRITSVNGRRIAYDAAGRISSVATDDAVATYRYDADGQEAGWTLALASGAAFTREVVRDVFCRGRIVAVTNWCASVLLGGFIYAHDACGRVLARNEDAFAYDTVGQVAEACHAVGTNAFMATYAYDLIGNRSEGQANGLNEYALIGGLGASYSANGELLAVGDRSYAYDSFGRLTSVATNGTPVLVNLYDADGRRVRSVDSAGTHTFAYDGWCPILERIDRADGSSETIEYVWGRDLSGTLQGAGGVGGLLYLKRNGTIYVPLYDAYGNVCAYADSTGAIVVSFAYDAFGNELADQEGTCAEGFRFRFSTKWYEGEAGLYYYGRRFYAPEYERWLTRDPLGEEGGANLYAFCGNAPTWQYDLLGALTLDEANEYWRKPIPPGKTKKDDLILPFSEVDVPDIRAEEFSQIQACLSLCREGTYLFSNARCARSAPSHLILVLGTITYKLRGTLQIDSHGDWRFFGLLKCYDDTYDFDWKPVDSWRTLGRNILTVGGRVVARAGTPYDIKIVGSRPFSDSGNCCSGRVSGGRW